MAYTEPGFQGLPWRVGTGGVTVIVSASRRHYELGTRRGFYRLAAVAGVVRS